MRISIDIYCDKGLILRTIALMHPAPTLYPPPGQSALVWRIDKTTVFSAWTMIADKRPMLFGAHPSAADIAVLESRKLFTTEGQAANGGARRPAAPVRD